MYKMERINEAISNYQKRIGKYDKQIWEQTVEQEVIKRLHNVPRKTAKVNPDLIDVDLFRGSAFSMSKAQYGWLSITRMALLRCFFLPFYYRWWKSCTGEFVFALLCLLYCLQVATFVVCFTNSEEDPSVTSLSTAHMFCPCVMMFVLALIHTQMMSVAESSTQFSRLRAGNKREKSCKKRLKVATNRRDSAGSHDTGIDLNPEDVGASSLQNKIKTDNFYHKKSTQPPGVAPEKHKSSDVDEATDLPVDLSSCRLTSDCTSAYDKTSDWVHKHSSETVKCDNVEATPIVQHAAKHSNIIECRSEDSAPCSDMLLGSDTCESMKQFSHSETITKPVVVKDSVVLGVRSIPEEVHSVKSVKNDNCVDICTETISNANSCASVSDAVDSSIISSLDDQLYKTANDKKGKLLFLDNKEDSLICDSSENLPYGGVRQRKIGSKYQKQVTDLGSDVLTDEGNTMRISPQFRNSRKDLVKSKSCESLDKALVSSDDEDEKNLQNSSSRQSLSSRRKLNGKSVCRQDSLKVQLGKSECIRQPIVKIIDVRHLESTGVSSCDSDTEGRLRKSKKFSRMKHTVRKPAEIATSELDDTVNTEVTSATETSSQASSGSDLSEKDIIGTTTENNNLSQGIQHATSIMNNLASNTDRVSCMIWEPNSVHKVDLTVLDIGWTIIQKVDKMPETSDYLFLGFIFSVLLMVTPVIYRIYHVREDLESLNYSKLNDLYSAAGLAFGQNWKQVAVIINGVLQRLSLSLIFFFLLSVAERTFKQRLLYAKNFCYLTSSRRAKKYDLPHFRLNKVRNIKTWLSLRSFLKKRGPQRTVDCIVSAAFLLAVVLLSVLCIELLQDYGSFLDHLSNWELVIWCMGLGIYLLRFITLGTKINKKYRNFSVLITEQINLYLHMEQKPHKKDELMVANSVLKLAEDLLKELESPFKISGLSANPFLYNITKVVVLSAFSAVLTELLGFKLKLYKIKIRA